MSILNALPHTLNFYNTSATQDNAGGMARAASLVLEDVPCFYFPKTSKTTTDYQQKQEQQLGRVAFTSSTLWEDVKVTDFVAIGSSTFEVLGKRSPCYDGRVYFLDLSQELIQFSLGETTSNTHKYDMTFTSADLTAGVLTVTHSLGESPVLVQVYNNEGRQVIPSEIEVISANVVEVDLSGFTVSGTWSVIVVG